MNQVSVDKIESNHWATWLPSLLQPLSVGRATMVAEQIAAAVQPDASGETIEIWATGGQGIDPTWHFSASSIPRAVIVSTMTPGADAVTILCGGFAAEFDAADTELAELLTQHLHEVVRIAGQSWQGRGFDLTFWCDDAGQAIGIRESLGFETLAQMHYRTADLKQLLDPIAAGDSVIGKDASGWPAIDLVAVSPEEPSGRKRIISVVERTYEDSADCAVINQYRSAAQTIDGYRRSTQYRADLWFVAVQQAGGEDQQAGGDNLGSEDVGVVIGSVHDDQQPVAGELVYVGLAEPFRGRGWSRTLFLLAARAFQAARCEAIWVAHDGSNAAAVALYDGFDLRLVYRQQMWFRSNRLATDAAAENLDPAERQN